MPRIILPPGVLQLLIEVDEGPFYFFDIPPAVHVPMNPEEIVPEGAFAGVPRLRHVSVESGIRLIGAEAWQNADSSALSNCRPLL